MTSSSSSSLQPLLGPEMPTPLVCIRYCAILMAPEVSREYAQTSPIGFEITPPKKLKRNEKTNNVVDIEEASEVYNFFANEDFNMSMVTKLGLMSPKPPGVASLGISLEDALRALGNPTDKEEALEKIRSTLYSSEAVFGFPNIAKMVFNNPTDENLTMRKHFFYRLRGFISPTVHQNRNGLQRLLSLIENLALDKREELHDILLIYIGHGKRFCGSLCFPDNSTMSPKMFFQDVKKEIHQENIRITVVMESCYSGYWCDHLMKNKAITQKIAIQSSADHDVSSSHTFIPTFLESIKQKKDLWNSAGMANEQQPTYYMTTPYSNSVKSFPPPITFLGNGKTSCLNGCPCFPF